MQLFLWTASSYYQNTLQSKLQSFLNLVGPDPQILLHKEQDLF